MTVMLGKYFTIAVFVACLIADNAFPTVPLIKSITREQIQPSAHRQVAGSLDQKIDEYLRRLTGFGFSGVMLVVKDGRLVLNKAYGLANKEQHIPNTLDTVFDIGSLAKQFTAAAILRLADRK